MDGQTSETPVTENHKTLPQTSPSTSQDQDKEYSINQNIVTYFPTELTDNLPP